MKDSNEEKALINIKNVHLSKKNYIINNNFINNKHNSY